MLRPLALAFCLAALPLCAAEPTAIFVPVPAGESWQEFAYLAAVPAASQLTGGTPAVVALDEFATVTPEVTAWLARYKPARILEVQSTANPAGRPRVELERGLVTRLAPTKDASRATGEAKEIVAAPSAEAAAFQASGWTVGGWFRMPKSPAAPVTLMTAGKDGADGWALAITSRNFAEFRVVRADDGLVESCRGIQYPVEPGRWHHLAGVMETDGTMKLYVDGRVRYFLPLGATARPPTTPLTFGAAKGVAEVEEVRVYDRPLSAGEMAALAMKPLPAVAYEIPGAEKLPALPGHEAAGVAVALSQRAWPHAARPVLVAETDYAGALLGSSLAARLGVPLLYFHATAGLDEATLAELKRLGAESALVIGESPKLDIPAVRFADATAVFTWLKAQGIPCDYLAAANANDRHFGMVRKASLAAPLLAARHQGMVAPVNFDTQYKLPIWSDATQTLHDRPPGALLGVRQLGATEAWERNDVPPKLAPGFTKSLHPVDGKYMKRVWAGYVPKMALAASHAGATAADLVLVDLNADQQFSDNEVFAIGDSFTLPPKSAAFYSPWEMRLRIVSVQDRKAPYSVELESLNWLPGRAQAGGRAVPFVISSALGYGFDSIQFDLNGDGRFDGAGEGPFQTADAVQIDGRSWAVTVNHHYVIQTPGHAALTYPAPADVQSTLTGYYAALGRHPNFLCLVGLHDVIPLGAFADSATKTSETPSDSFYANVDADLFEEIAVGRVVGESALDATLLATRSSTYEALWDESWGRRVVSTGDWTASTREISYRLENAGFLPALEPAEKYQGSDLANAAFITHAEHACNWGWGYGPTMDLETPLAPCLAESFIGCTSASFELTRPTKSPRWPAARPGQWVSTLLLHQGAVAVIGNTEPASGFNNTPHTVFYDSLLAGRTAGEALRDGVNAGLFASTYDAPAYAHAARMLILLGDPAWRPHLPAHDFKTQPARLQVAGSKLTVLGPTQWWPTKSPTEPLRNFAAGISPEYAETGFAFLRWDTAEKITSLRQLTPTKAPLGWNGKYSVDEHQDGTRTLMWRVKLITTDPKTGEIKEKLDRIDFEVNPEPPKTTAASQ